MSDALETREFQIDEPDARTKALARSRFRSTRSGPWLFPVAVVSIVLVLTGLGWSGTSIGVTDPGNGHVVAGTPRPIRSDEWNVITPLVVAQSHHGYPGTSVDSIGSHNLGVILDVPTKTWPTVFRPWDYGFFLLDVERGFAFRWWSFSAILLLGAYGLLLQLTRRLTVAAVFSVALWASPFFHWWYLGISWVSAGMGMAALAAFLAALDHPRGPARYGLIVLSAWALVSFALVLYPPFQIPIAIVMVLVGLADLWARYGSARDLIRLAGPPLGSVLLLTLVVLVAYYLANRGAIHLISNTVYPGRRRDTGGVDNLYQYFSAPYGLDLAVHGSGLSISNQSEISSFIPIAPYVCLQLLRLRPSALADRARWLLTGAVSAFLLLSIWYFVGLPGPISIITGLDRVPPTRAIGGIGVAGLLVVALFSTGIQADPLPRNASPSSSQRLNGVAIIPGALAIAALAFGVTYWSGRMLAAASPGLGIGSHTELIASLAVAGIVFFVTAGNAIFGGLLLAVLGMAVSLPVNPLYSGLAPYTSAGTTGLFTSIGRSDSGGWLSFIDIPVSDILISSGVRTVNSVSLYPNPQAWRILDPSGSQRQIWDRYANLSFVAEPGLATPRLDLIAPDHVDITVDPCWSGLRKLGVRFEVLPRPSSESCLSPVTNASVLGTPVFVYRLNAMAQ